MDTSMENNQKINYEYEKRLTLPIFLFLLYLVCIFFTHIYTLFPVLRTIKFLLLVGILLVISYFITRDRYHNVTAYKHPFVKLWIGFLIIMLFGLINSIDRGMTKVIIEGSYKYFLIFMIMIKIIDTPKRLNLILGVFVLCGVGMAFSTLIGVVPPILGYRAIAIKTGIFADPNDLAFLLCSILPFLLFFYLKERKKLITKLITIAGITIVITAIVLTYSRGGFLGLCAVGFGFAIFIARKSKRYIFLILAGAVLVWSFAPMVYKARMSTITEWSVDPETGLTGTRIDSWLPILKAGLRHPVIGSGAGTSLYINGLERGDWHVVHNSFIQAFAEMGVIAFLCYILLFIIPFKKYRALIRQNVSLSSDDLLRIKVILISIFSYAVPAFFLPQAYSPILYFLTGIYIIQSELISKSTIRPNVSE
jgi:O-antigen ligase